MDAGLMNLSDGKIFVGEMESAIDNVFGGTYREKRIIFDRNFLRKGERAKARVFFQHGTQKGAPGLFPGTTPMKLFFQNNKGELRCTKQ